MRRLIAVSFFVVVGLGIVVGAPSYAQRAAEQPKPQEQEKHGAKPKDQNDHPGAQDGSSKPSPATVKDIPASDLTPKGKADSRAGDQKRGHGIDWQQLATIGNAAATVCIAAFTFFLVLFGGKQIRQLRRSVDTQERSVLAQRDSVEAQRSAIEHMRDREQRELRAYVVVQSIAIVNVAGDLPQPPPTPGTHAFIVNPHRGPVASATIINAGKTPARQVQTIANIVFREFPLIGQLPPLDLVGPRQISVLGPGIGVTVTRIMGPPLTEPETANLLNRASAIYMYGFITYLDAYEVDRRTDFRLMYFAGGGPIGTSTSLNFCDEGNDAN